MIRRAFLGWLAGMLPALLVRPAPAVEVPAEVEQVISEMADRDKLYWSVERIDGRLVWKRCYF